MKGNSLRTGKNKNATIAVGTWIRMLKAHNLVLREVRKRMNNNCTIAQFDVLAQLARDGGETTLAALSRQLLVTAGNVTGLIDRMEAAGLVKRERNMKDRRITKVILTDKGRALSRKIIPKHGRDVHQIFSGLSEKEMQQMRHLLDKLIQSMINTSAPASGRHRI